jgi:hypothetical protein
VQGRLFMDVVVIKFVYIFFFCIILILNLLAI